MSKSKLALLWAVLTVTAFAEGESVVNLEKTIITSATGFATDVRDIASNPKIVTSEEIKEKQYNTIEEVLENTPGVTLTYDNKGIPTINMRGIGKDTSNNYRAETNVKVMIDGIPCDTLNTDFGGTPLTAIPISSIERVEVIPGGGAVLYGSGTSAGVINIITKEGRGTRGSVDYKFSEYGGNLANVNAGHTIGNLDVDLTYSKEHGDGYRDDTDKDLDSFIGKLRYSISDTQKLAFKYTKVNDERHYAESLTKQELYADREQNGKVEGSNNLYRVKTDEYVVSYDNKLTDNFEFNIMGYYKKGDIYTDYLTESMGSKRRSQNTSEDSKKGINAKGKYSYGEGSYVTFGTEYKKDEYDTVTMGSPKEFDKDTISFYILNNYKLRERLDLITGVRYEKADYEVLQKNKTIEADEDGTAYEIGLNYLYSETGNAYIKYEKAFLLPTATSIRNSIYKTGEVYYSGVKPSDTNNYEIGIKDVIGNTFVSAAIYYSVTDDEMAKDVTNFNIINYNLGKTKRKGVELALEHNFERLTLKGSYNYVDAEIKKGKYGNPDGGLGVVLDDTKISNAPEHQFTIGADYKVTDKFIVMGDLTYTSGVYVGNSNRKRGYDLGKQNEHTVVNLRAKYEVTTNLNLYAGINNLFDEDYYYYVSQETTSIDGFAYDPAPGRNYYVGFSYSF